MKTIQKPGDNLGGLLKIWAVPSDVVSVENGIATITSTTNVYQLYCTPESMEFTEPKEVTGAGIVYNTSIGGFIPGNQTDLQEALEYIEPRKWVVIFRDGNGNYLAAGASHYPLRAAGEIRSGRLTADASGCQLTFGGKTLARAKSIANPFITD